MLEHGKPGGIPETFELGVLDFEHVAFVWESGGFNFLSVRGQRVTDYVGRVHVLLCELRLKAVVHANDVVEYLDLAVRSTASTNPNCGNVQRLGDLRRNALWHALQDDGEAAGFLQRHCILVQPHSRFCSLSLDLEPAELCRRLRGQPNVPLDGDARIDDSSNAAFDAGAPFELHGVHPTLLHEAAGVLDRIVNVQVASKRQVADKERVLRGPGHGLAVVQHVVHGDLLRPVVAELDHPKGVSDQQNVKAGAVREEGRGVVVGSDHRYVFLVELLLLYARNG